MNIFGFGFARKLREVPTLGKFLRKMIKDPSISSNIKRILRLITKPHIEISRLTEEWREELQLDPDVCAVHSQATVITEIQGNSYMVLPQFEGEAGHFLFVQARPISSAANDLIGLIHELAHIRMSFFLIAYQKKLLPRFAPHLMREGDYRIVILDEFEIFLSERYAHMLGYQVLKERRSHGVELLRSLTMV